MHPPLILVNGEVKDDIVMAGADLLRKGASAADVAEQIARAVEDDIDEHTVGFSGLPNILGEVELDAAFMEGATLRAGAVAAVKGFRHPIFIARQVMERLPHVLLAGEGAERFGDEIGAERGALLTESAHDMWLKRIRECGLTIEDIDAAKQRRSPYSNHSLIEIANRALAHRAGSDTMNVMVRDAHGHMVVAVTTSGIAWKYPGRVGDSPIIGAGLYVDDRYGAAACMGLGEVTIRQSSSARAVLMMQMGKTIDEAGRAVLRDMLPLCRDAARHWSPPDSGPFPRSAWVRLLLMDKQGAIGGYCTHDGSTYKTQTVDERRPRTLTCEWVREETLAH
ncbi:MAG: isoaspartyl peptidase/L-asparaginase [Anaerolineae bacterium]|nr:isoaspartyl peptidase/L-asparaginase [Thermoflexales bacterium]MDW8406314.1 isoaspartyl peptidase/L-asparaginase [Anaerolineae bacterium]